jgi:HK97 family phage prohead protease
MEANETMTDNRRAFFAPGMLETRDRPMQKVDWRESGSGDGTRILEGYASTFNQEYTLYEGDDWVLKERIEPTFFDNILATNPDVFLNVGHDMNKVMGRTLNKTGVSGLKLTTDNHGLAIYSRLNPANKAVQEITPMMDDRLMDQMSFAFRVNPSGVRWETSVLPDGRELDIRVLTDCSQLVDVCVCAMGANDNTEASLRSYIDAIKETKRDGTRVTNRDGRAKTAEGTPVDNPEVPVKTQGTRVDSPAVKRDRLALLARAKEARVRYNQKEYVYANNRGQDAPV